MLKVPTKIVALIIPLVFWTTSVVACPKIGRLIDFNCDQKQKIVGLGDSFVVGKGDLELKPEGGYMGRLQLMFPKSKLIKLGIGGITSQRLLTFVKGVFEKEPKGKIANYLGTADILIIDVGRNDFYDGDTPAFTVATLKRLGLYIQEQTKARFKSSPLLVFAFLAPTTRKFEAPFIGKVNKILLATRSEKFPAYLRFDLLDPMYISNDGLHPTATGHQFLADLAAEYIINGAQDRSKAQRVDLDKDGIYDIFEKLRFGTSPKTDDTDLDGLKDGEEVFTYKTNPLIADTDGDGISDGEEVANGTDPLVKTEPTPTPVPFATPMPLPTATATATPTVAPVI